MKVLDLRCAFGHAFEGWFACEEDFASQSARALVQCPLCGNSEVVKLLSAPRLNLLTRRTDDHREPQPTAGEDCAVSAAPVALASAATQHATLMAAWLAVSREVVAHTADVGDKFAEEARKMHYQEVEAHPIRGTASPDETRALLDEGIDVLPLMLPEFLKDTLQ
jgi:hypothetical protein